MKEILRNQIDRFCKQAKIQFKDKSSQFEYFSGVNILKGIKYTDSQILASITDGSYDEGIDAIFAIIDEELYTDSVLACENIRKGSNISFIFAQMKQEENYSEKVLHNLQKGIKYCFEEQTGLANEAFKKQANLIKAVWDKHTESACEKKIVVKVFCIIEANSGIQGMENERIAREVSEINKLVQTYGFINETNLWGCKELIEISNKYDGYRKALKTIECFDYPEQEDDIITGYIAIVNGYDYFKFITDEHDEIEEKIFEENIRDYQGNQGVNEKITYTLESEQKRNFWCMNNGITMIGYKKDKKGKNIWLSDYQIINGCQTSHSIYNYFKSIDREMAEQVKFEVIVKIIQVEEEDDELLLKIIDSTNSQTGVDAYAFESHKSVHRLIERYFLAKGSKFYYERRPNSYARKNIHSSLIINPQKLLQIMYAIYYKKPSEARNIPGAIFDNKKDEIFKEENQYEFYWMACNLFRAVDTALVNNQFDNLTDAGMYIYKNGIFHISRVIFSLVLEKEIKISSKLNMKDYQTQLGENIAKLMDKDLDVSEYLKEAIMIIEEALKKIMGISNSKNIANIFRVNGLEEEITKQTAIYINEKNLSKITANNNYNQEVVNQQKIDDYISVLKYYQYCFSNISNTGDFRFNFKDRLNDLIYWTKYYNDIIAYSSNISTILETSLQVNENDRDDRIEKAQDIHRLINKIIHKITESIV